MNALVAGLLAGSDPAAAASARAQPVIDRFHRAVVDCGFDPGPKPTLRVEMGRGVVHFERAGVIVIYPWETTHAGTQAALTRLVRDQRERSGRDAYQAIFNELLVAHELGQWLQSGRSDQDQWQSEYNANQIMVAFWREHPQGRSTARRLAEYLRFTPGDRNPMPPPPGQSHQAYFNSNYEALMRSPAYGWYQNAQGRSAVSERPVPRFCSLVRAQRPAR